MPRGEKFAYTDKQKRQAEHIEEGYETRGFGTRGRAACLGHGEQGNRRRQKERQRAWQGEKPRAVAQGRPAGWRGGSQAAGGCASRGGEEGRGDTQAESRARLIVLRRLVVPNASRRRRIGRGTDPACGRQTA